MPPTSRSPSWKSSAWRPSANRRALPLQPRDQAVNIAEHEQVAHLDDLVLRYARDTKPHTCLSIIAFFNTAISFAGLRPFGQAFEQFMMVWQR